MPDTTASSPSRFAALRGVLWFVLAAVTALAPAQEPGAAPAAPATIPAARQADRVVIIPIVGQINGITASSVERRLKIAEDAQADAVVFELDTPGGEVGAAIEICTMIKRSSIGQTVAWVNPDAYSAGVFIALACDRILTSPACTMGDAAPIAVTGVGAASPTGTLRAKVESFILSEVIDSARRNGYDEQLVQSFVVPEMELWLIEHKETGKQLFVTAKEFEIVFGEEPESNAIPRAEPPQQADPTDQADRIMEWFRPIQQTTGEGQFSREQVETEVEAAQALQSSRPTLTEEDRGDYLLVEQVVDRNTLLTIKGYDILRYGLGETEVSNDVELKQYFGATQVDRLDESWSEALTVFFMQPWVRGVLIAIMLIAGLIEFSAPGIGLPGAVALICLFFVIGAPALAGMAAWWEVAAIFLGIVLVLVELFLIPGLGVAGVSGLLLLLFGLVGTFVPNAPGHLLPRSGQETNAAFVGIATVLASVFAAMVGGYFISKHIRSFPVLGKLVLTDVSPRSESSSGSVFSAMGGVSTPAGVVVGDEGVVLMPLRPSGKAEFDGQLLDVSTDEGFIERGARVRVVEVGSMRIVVERISEGGGDEGAVG